MFGRFAGLAETLVAKARLSWGQHLRQKSRDLSIERDFCGNTATPVTCLVIRSLYQ